MSISSLVSPMRGSAWAAAPLSNCVTSGCVRASVVDAFQFGFRALLVEDCCGDQEEGPHNDTLRDVGRRYADIVSSDEVIERLKLNSRGVT